MSPSLQCLQGFILLRAHKLLSSMFCGAPSPHSRESYSSPSRTKTKSSCPCHGLYASAPPLSSHVTQGFLNREQQFPISLTSLLTGLLLSSAAILPPSINCLQPSPLTTGQGHCYSMLANNYTEIIDKIHGTKGIKAMHVNAF